MTIEERHPAPGLNTNEPGKAATSAAFLLLLPGSYSADQAFQTPRQKLPRKSLPFALLMIFAIVLPALAGPFEDAIGKFADDDYASTEEAVGVIATSGNPLAFSIISALQDGRLMADPDTKKDLCHPARRQDRRCRDRRCRRQRSRLAPRRSASTTICAAPSRPHSAA